MTIDDLIADLEELRGVYGGGTEVVVARWLEQGGTYDVRIEPDVCLLSFPWHEGVVLGIGDLYPPTEDDGDREDVPIREVA